MSEGQQQMRIAFLDDYQSVALDMADWSRLPDNVELVSFTDHAGGEDALVARLSDFDAVCRVRERTPFPRSVLERLPRLKLLLATGIRNSRSIDLAAAEELGITVCATGSHHFPTVEIVWGMVLSLFRGIHREHASLRAGGWQLSLSRCVRGKTIGILGLGRLGTPVAEIARAFGMEVAAWSPNLTDERAAAAGARRVSKEELFRDSDVVTIHMPESERSIGIVGAAEIALMKPDAFLINTSRPGLVDQDALLTALIERRIGGAGLDVFDIEPLPRDHPYRYLPNVLATPHIGFVIEENYRIYFGETLENVLAYLDGAPIRTLDASGEMKERS
ncbi:D-2-hydroxyacid dehydrogenase family protein [Roseitranquillus sediminis]|uniref:D-2-hydroxyacid dehydrogenase family protein n=1 Tax=Roseitranquillus sediminis TaxID=2809051 RepID=UPI001D0C6EF8|nr:D-2-hydroxyacid dehydrogenase family protein [Roseitranquillus sediminis]MBM9593880.1 D-2-hydroxyacid dehydrogenase family protein [Roseitranquillus sediminis]